MSAARATGDRPFICTVHAEVVERFPGTDLRFVTVDGLECTGLWEEVDSLIMKIEHSAAAGDIPDPSPDDPLAALWFAAYREFGSNPNRTKPSFFALTRRVARSGRFPRVNPAVDAYNAMSVRHGVPAGAMDLDAVVGPVQLRLAVPGDSFEPIGSDEAETPKLGEVVYADSRRVLTRHWNHRDCDATKLTASTRRAVFILEGVDGSLTTAARLDRAQDELAGILRTHVSRICCDRINAGAS